MSGFSLRDLAPEHIQRFTPYEPSRPDPELMRLFGVERLVRLNNNENHLGPPPAAQKLLAGFAPPRAAIYPSGDCYYLRLALAERFGKDPGQFLVGNGSCEVITSVIKAFCEPGDNIVTADRTFAVYEWVAEFSGFEARLTPLKDFGFDPEAMLAAVDARTKIVFLCNPNNPTGSYWTREVLDDFLDRLGGRCVVVIDEAYIEFVEKSDAPDGMRLMERRPEVVVFRTFSKMYGLAGLRVGYLCASPEIADMVRRTHIVYSVNTLAQECALAALADDSAHIEATRAMVREARDYLVPALESLGLPVVAGEGNYIMARAPMPDTKLYRLLMKRGLMVRTMTGFRFPDWLRVTLAPMEHMRALTTALSDILGVAS